MFDRFTPGNLTSTQAAKLNELMSVVTDLQKPRPVPPYAIRQYGVSAILAEITDNNGATIPVHTAKRLTNNIQSGVTANTIIDTVPEQPYTEVLSTDGGTIATGTRVLLYPILENPPGMWATPVSALSGTFVSNVCPVYETIYGVEVMTGITVEYTDASGNVSCVTNPTDCCAVLSACSVCLDEEIASSLYITRINGCDIVPDECTLTVLESNGIDSWYKGTACGGGAGCVCILAARMFCHLGVFKVDITVSVGGVSANYPTQSVTVVSCDPFCGYFTVPSWASGCTTDIIYRISASPDATCGDELAEYDCVGGVCVETVGGAYASLAACLAAPCDAGIEYHALGTNTGSGSASTTVSFTVIMSESVPANSMLAVSTMGASLGGYYGDVTGVTFAGTPMVEVTTTTAVDDLRIETKVWLLAVASATTGMIEATVKNSDTSSRTTYALMTAAYYSGCPLLLADEVKSDNGSAGTPDTGVSGTTAYAAEGVFAAMGMGDFGSAPSPGTWQNGFTAGQSVVLDIGSTDLTLSDGWLVLSATGTWQAEINSTHDIWNACGASFG